MGTVKLKLEWPFLGVGNLNERTSSCVVHCYSGKKGTGAFLPVKLPLSKVRCRDIHQYEAVFTLVPHAGSGSTPSRPKQDEELCSRVAPSLQVLGLCPCATWPEPQHRADVCRAVECSDRGHWSDFLSKMLVPALQVLHVAPGGWLPLAATGCPVKNTWIVVPKQNMKRRECLRLGQMPDTRSFRHMGWRLKLQVIENRGS